MATSAKNSYNFYQNGKFSAALQNPQTSMEVTQDMHLKMSKKIAQLTKVIYALNTKNDEHEVIIQNISEQHETEIQQLLNETKQKLEVYKEKFDNEVGFTQQLRDLQDRLHQQELYKATALAQFDDYKKRAEEREVNLKTEHSKKLVDFSQQVLQAKNDFEERLKSFEEFKAKTEAEYLQRIENLKEEHRKELELTAKSHTVLNDVEAEKLKLEEHSRHLLNEIQEKYETVQNEKDALKEDFEFKLNKAQTFYEKELAAIKEAQSKTDNDQLDLLQQENTKLKRDFSFQESQYKNRIDKLLRDLSETELEIERYKNEIKEYKQNILDSNLANQTLNEELKQLKNELSTSALKLHDLETDLVGTKQRCKQQAQDLLRKSTEIVELEATRLQHESTIKELNSRVVSLQDRITLLETSKRALESQVGETQSQTSSQLKTLERALEDLTIEKRTIKEELEREICTLKDTAAAKETKIIAEYEAKLEILKEDHRKVLDAERSSNEEQIEKLSEELWADLSAERGKLKKALEELQIEYDNVKADLTSKLDNANKEIRRLEQLLNERENGLGSATSQIDSLKDSALRLKNELDTTRNDLKVARGKAANLESSYERLSLQHEAAIKEAETTLKVKLEKLSHDLDNKWSDTLRKECEKLHIELTTQKDEEKRAEIQHLLKLKDEEMQAAKNGWQEKFNQLLQEISSLKNASEKELVSKVDEINKIKHEADIENNKLRQEILRSAEEYSGKIEALEKLHGDKLQQIIREKEQLLKELEEDLKNKHVEDMRIQLTAHKSTVDMVKSNLEKEKQKALEDLEARLHKNLENVRVEMQHHHNTDMDEINKQHQLQLQAARMELDRAIELSKQKENEYVMKNSELEENVRHRQEAILRLEEDLHKLQEGINEMSHELEAKGKEILNTRSDANRKLRLREEQLLKQHEEDVISLQSDYSREKKDMLYEFQQAQSLLKDKIAAMQLMLEEAEDRYRNRESRPEDVDLIEQLKEAIIEREQALKRMIDDKKYYQMELVNRETNFNKVFNASPNVGVLNPLNAKTRPKDKGAVTKHSSSPALHAVGSHRLDPLPNSPVHDASFNANKPLPPMKKFVK